MTCVDWVTEFVKRFGDYEGESKDGPFLAHRGKVGKGDFIWMGGDRFQSWNLTKSKKWERVQNVNDAREAAQFAALVAKFLEELGDRDIYGLGRAVKFRVDIPGGQFDASEERLGFVRVHLTMTRQLFGEIHLADEWESEDPVGVRLACEEVMGKFGYPPGSPFADWLKDNVPDLEPVKTKKEEW